MCDHEGQPCPGRSCRCVCMNCMFPDKEKPGKWRIIELPDEEMVAEVPRVLGQIEAKDDNYE